MPPLNYILTPFAIASLLATVVSSFVALFLLLTNQSRTAKYLFVLMLSITWYTLFTGIEYSATNLADKIFWTKVEYLGVLTTPVLFLICTLELQHSNSWLTKNRIVALFLIPGVTYLLALSNDFHHLIWTSSRLSGDENQLYIVGHGIWFWIGVVGYSYFLVLIASLLLIRVAFRFLVPYRVQAILLLVAAVTPLIGNLFYLFNFFTAPGYDPTSALFAISGVLFTIGILRFRLLNYAPLAFNQLVENLSDSVLVLNQSGELVYINHSAVDLITTSKLAFLLDDVGNLPKLGNSLPFISIMMGEASEKVIRLPGATSYLKVTAKPLVDDLNQAIGTIILLQDVTSVFLARLNSEQTETARIRFEGINVELTEKLNSIQRDFEVLETTLLEMGASKAQEKLSNIRTTVNIIDRDIRQSILGLNRMDFTHESFREVLLAYIDDFAKITGIKVQASFPEAAIDNSLHSHTFATLNLVMQDLLYFTQKFTFAKTITIIVTLDSNNLGVTFTVDGRTKPTDQEIFNAKLQDIILQINNWKGEIDIRETQSHWFQCIIRFKVLPNLTRFASLVGLRILLIDQHQLFVDGITPLLTEIGMNVISVSRTTSEAREVYNEYKPDMVIVDPTVNNLFADSLLDDVTQSLPPARIVFLTDDPSEEVFSKVLERSFNGFLLKNRSVIQLAESLVEILNGNRVISPELSNRLLAERNQNLSSRQKTAIQQLANSHVSSKQIEILRAFVEGKVYKEIAIDLSMSESAVKYHIVRVMQMLGVENRNELVKFLLEIGLGK